MKKTKNNQSLDMKELEKWNWNRCSDPDILLVRRMLYDNPLEILRIYGKNELKKVFLKNLHHFKRENYTFWKLILDISDEEVEQRTKKVLELLAKSGVFEKFYLTGGTAITIKYDHRLSEDLDFFTLPQFTEDNFPAQELLLLGAQNR